MLEAAYPGAVTIVNDDAMRVDETETLRDGKPAKIVSNLPYNISTELLIKWLKAGSGLWQSMT